MTNIIEDVLSSKQKHKEQVETITQMALQDESALALVMDVLKTGTDVNRGTAAEVLKFVSQQNPDSLLPYLDVIIEYIDYKAPRVRWGCPESIGYIAGKYPQKVEGAIPKLLGNLKDPSTVVRWCAAFALTEIAKHNLERQSELAVTLRELASTEQNNGVRNLYLKALKAIEKG